MDYSIRSKNEKMTAHPVKPLQMALKHLRHGMAGRAVSSTHGMSFIHGVAWTLRISTVDTNLFWMIEGAVAVSCN